MVLWWLPVVVALNVGLAVTQIVIGTSVRSLALVSDGAHTLSDALAAYVAWLAEAVHKRPADEALPFGYARATTVGALVNVAALEALCLSIALSALCKFYRPDAVSDLRALLIVSAVGAVVNVASALMACCGVEGAHVHVGGGVCDGNHAPVAGAGRWASIGRMACADGCCAAAPPPPPLQTFAFQAPMQRGAKRPPSSQVPEKLIALKKVIEESMRNYAVCDELCYKLPAQDFKLRWDLYSWPKKITDECVLLEEKCIRLENKQQIEMEEAQAEFAETLKYYQSEVDALSQFHDLKLVDSIALKVSTIKGNLAKADDDARLYLSLIHI